MRVSLHVGPHRTGTMYIQHAAHRNRAELAKHGIRFINEPAQSNEVARAIVNGRADIALAKFDKLCAAAEANAPRDVNVLLHSSEMFAAPRKEQRADYEKAFGLFVARLEERGHAVELVFVERNPEDLLTSNALLQTSLGNLQFVTPDPQPFLLYLQRLAWLKSYFFGRFKVVHLDFALLTGSGDLLANFVKLAYGLDGAALEPVDPAIDARNSSSDAQLARGLVMAPVINWLEQFGSLPRSELFNTVRPFAPPIPEAAWVEIAKGVPLLRDSVRVTARHAIELFSQSAGA